MTLFLSSLFSEDLLSRLFSREKLCFQKYISPCSVPELLQALFMIVCLFELITLMKASVMNELGVYELHLNTLMQIFSSLIHAYI